MKNEETIIIPTDYEQVAGAQEQDGTAEVGASPETRGVAVKKRASLKDIFFGDIDWKACGRALTKEVSFEGFKRVMTSDVDFSALKTVLFSPVPDVNIDLGGAIKRFCSIQVKF